VAKNQRRSEQHGQPSTSAATSSTSAQLAVTVADSEVSIAGMTPEERHAKWMQYLRSRNITATRDRPFGQRAARTSKMPENLEKQVNEDPKHFFNIWRKCKGDWAKVQLEEENVHKRSIEVDQAISWVRKDRLEEILGEGPAQAYMEAARDNPEYHDPNDLLPANDDLALWEVHLTKDIKMKDTDLDMKRRKLTADLSADTPDAVISALGPQAVAPQALEGGQKEPEKEQTPEKIAEEEQKKAEEKQRRKLELAKKHGCLNSGSRSGMLIALQRSWN